MNHNCQVEIWGQTEEISHQTLKKPGRNANQIDQQELANDAKLKCNLGANRHGNCSPNGPRARACASTRWPWRPAWRPTAKQEADRLGLAGEARAALLELYSTTALLHDFDYERHPTAEEHPFVGVRELERLGWPEEMRTAILGHAQYSGVPRVTHLAKALFACDELAGFLTACALVKPTKAIADVEVASVKKKMKDKAFARGVHREDIVQGAAELGVDLDAHIGFCIEAMKKRAGELGL